jgi:hypothetical protein
MIAAPFGGFRVSSAPFPRGSLFPLDQRSPVFKSGISLFYYGLCYVSLLLATVFFGVGDHVFQFLSREIELFDALLNGKWFIVRVSIHIRFAQIEV